MHASVCASAHRASARASSQQGRQAGRPFTWLSPAASTNLVRHGGGRALAAGRLLLSELASSEFPACFACFAEARGLFRGRLPLEISRIHE